MNSAKSPPPLPARMRVPLRVRFYPLWGWLFVGCVLFAQTFIATRFWGGFNALALVRLLAFQIMFLPRIALAAAGVALGLTILTTGLIRWIARPLAARWLEPLSIIPPAAELPLYLGTGECVIRQAAARRKAEHLWEPGWLIWTDRRLVWLSGVWRTIEWEIDGRDPERPIASRFRLGRVPRWFGGYVTGAPRRLLIERDFETRQGLTRTSEVLAMIDPEDFMGLVSAWAESSNQAGGEPVGDEPESAGSSEPDEHEPAMVPGREGFGRTAGDGAMVRPKLPPLRDYARRKPVRNRGKDEQRKEMPVASKTMVRGVALPPRRLLG